MEKVTRAELSRTTCGAHEVAVITVSREDGSPGPATLGPLGLRNLADAVATASGWGAAGEVSGIVLTGVDRTFLAGADLTLVRGTRNPADGRALGNLGHAVVSALLDAPVPTVALVNGTALGGGLELALACDMRLAHAGARPLGLPETYLGLIPGWGGCFLLPHLIGPGPAAEVIITNPAHNNTTLSAAQALELGVVDRLWEGDDFPAGEIADLLDHPARPHAPESSDPDAEEWAAALAPHKDRVRRAALGGRPAPERALDLLRAARDADRTVAFGREDEALADLVASDALHDGLYAVELLRRARPPRVTSPIRRLGVIGGGLMASQLATLLAARLGVRVVMKEVDDARCERTRGLLARERESLGGRLAPAQLEAVAAAITVGTDYEDFGDADLVIEAVFEEMGVKQAVFAEVEPHLRPDAILATNTSALSVTEMGSVLARPERLVGIHFFNPVAAMPLVEVVHTARTDDDVLDTARTLVHAAGKVTVDVADAPGFIVNRLLVRLLGEVLGELESGTDVDVAARALDPLGLPMGPLQLLQLVGPAVAAHVLHTLRRALGERYPESPGLDAIVADGASFLLGRPSAATPHDPAIARYFTPSDPAPSPAEVVLRRVQLALAEEIHLMVDAGVADVDSVNVAMLAGAGWPVHRGGITPYLDEVGASEASGGLFHPDGI